MCLICIEYEKGKLKAAEALRNLSELKENLDPDHVKEIQRKIINDTWEKWDFKLNDLSIRDDYYDKHGNGD